MAALPGVRTWVNIAVLFIHFYRRHQENIDAALPLGVASAMGVLADAIEAIKDLNLPGPG